MNEQTITNHLCHDCQKPIPTEDLDELGLSKNYCVICGTSLCVDCGSQRQICNRYYCDHAYHEHEA